MPLEESSEDLAQAEGPLVVKFRKLDIPPIDYSKEFLISTEEDFDSARKIAHAYAKGYPQGQPTLEIFRSIGIQIGHDFQFVDQGGGVIR